MKQLKCEMCGSTELLKEDGVFVCQTCGTKYSVEEAKKMMVEGIVEVQGTVKVDDSTELKNIYILAREASKNGNSKNAQEYYKMILLKNPLCWEANFFVVYYQAMNTNIAGILSAALNMAKAQSSILDLILKDESLDEHGRDDAIYTVVSKTISASSTLGLAAVKHFYETDYRIRYKYTDEARARVNASLNILLNLADNLEKKFNTAYTNEIVAELLSAYLSIGVPAKEKVGDSFTDDYITQIGDRIRKYRPSYQKDKAILEKKNATKKSGGCYVATCVYGSYDCPQVWTLRRFRDNTLAETWYGRAFIHTYYAISPTVVKWFGNTAWFKKLWKGKLDRMVKKLNNGGVENTPYEDRSWR